MDNLNLLKTRYFGTTTVSKVVQKFEDASLLNGTRKDKKKFLGLTKADKRAWRDALQRAINAARNRVASRVLAGYRISHMAKEKMFRAEARRVKDLLNESGLGSEVVLQTGVDFALGATLGSLSGAVPIYSLSKSVQRVATRMEDAVEDVTQQVNDLSSYAREGITSLKQVGENIASDVRPLVEKIKDVADSMKASSQSAAITTDAAAGFMTELKDAFHSFLSSLSVVSGVVKRLACAALVWWVCSYYDIGIITTTFLALLSTVAPEASCLIKGWVSGLKLQSGIEDCASIATLFLTCWMPGMKDTGFLAGDFMRRVSTFPRARDGISKFLESILELFERFVNFVLRRSDDNMITFITKNDVFTKWCKKTSDYLQFLAIGTENLGITKILEIRDHYITGLGLYEHLHERDAQEKWKYLSGKLGLALQPHQGAITASHNLRVMPVWAQFAGPSGVGKTSLIKSVASIALWASGEVAPKEALANIWQKGTTEYWNGYVGQKCLVVDDAFQVKPRQGESDSEAMQFIRAVGNFAYPLSFADVESKGKHYLNTPLILSTTNAKNIVAEWEPYITSPTALARRIQHGYWVSVAEDWQDVHGRLNYQKFQDYINERVMTLLADPDREIMADEVIDVVPWHAWIIRKHAFDSSMVTHEIYEPGMRDVVLRIAQELKDRRQAHVSELKTFDDWTSVMDRVKFRLEDGLGEEVFYDPDEHLDYVPTDDVVTGVRLALNPRMSATDSEIEPATPSVSEIARDDIWDMPQYAIASKEISEPVEMAIQFGSSTNRLRQSYEVCKKLASDLKLWASTWIEKFLGPNLGRSLFMTAGIFGVLALSYKLIRSIVRGTATLVSSVLEIVGLKAAKVESQSGEGVAGVKAKRVEFKFPAALRRSDHAKLQVGVPPQEGVYDKVYDNVFKVTLEYADKDPAPVGHFTGIGSNVMLFNKHFINTFDKAPEGTQLHFQHATSDYELRIPVECFLSFKRVEAVDYDLCAVAMDVASIKVSRNILNKFMREEDLKKVLKSSNLPCRIDVCDVKVRKQKATRTRVSYNAVGFEYMPGSLGTTQGVTLRGLVKYRMNTKAGDCGGLLCLSENRHYGGKCIIGLHSAGQAKTFVREGYATIVTKELVTDMFMELTAYKEETLEAVHDDQHGYTEEIQEVTSSERLELQDAGLIGGCVTILGKLRDPINIAASTSLHPSLMQEEQVLGPSPTAPAVLRPVIRGDEIKIPMVQGTKAYQSPVIYEETSRLAEVCTVALSRHVKETEGAYRGILSFEEAVVPPEHLKLKTVNARTSPGYKYRKYVTPATPGKTYFFGQSDDWTKDCFERKEMDLIRADVQDIVQKAAQGVRKVHLCTDFLKDELRPLKKVDDVMTRVISGTALDYSIAVRMYFGAYLSATFQTRIHNGMAPGINHYTEWGELAASLIGDGRTKFFDGDFSRFDSSEQPWIQNALLQAINAWYQAGDDWNPIDDQIRAILWLDLIHSRHIVGLGHQLCYVVQWNKSLPSGHPLTTLVNSMYSLVSIVACYFMTTGRLDFWDHCFVNTFGDDNIVAVDDEVCDQFNQVTVASAMAKLGLVYTSGRKGAELEPFTKLENVTFLKRTFLRDEDGDRLVNRKGVVPIQLVLQDYLWVGPLDPASFLYEAYWYKNKKDPWGDVERRLEHLLGELALHPQEMWDKHAPPIFRFIARNGLNVPLHTRREARHAIKSRFDVWF